MHVWIFSRGQQNISLVSPLIFRASTNRRIYDTSTNDTSPAEPFRRKGFLSKCHFVECPLRQSRVLSNTFDEIFNAHLAAILYLLIL